MVKQPEQEYDKKTIWWLHLIQQTQEAKEGRGTTWMLVYKNHCPYNKTQKCFGIKISIIVSVITQAHYVIWNEELLFLTYGTLQFLTIQKSHEVKMLTLAQTSHPVPGAKPWFKEVLEEMFKVQTI